MLKPFEKPQPDAEDETVARDLTEIVDRVAEFLAQLEPVAFLDCRTIEGQALNNAANTTIKHKLGRKPRGWFPVRHRTAAATIYEISSDSTDLVLFASAACTVDLVVF